MKAEMNVNMSARMAITPQFQQAVKILQMGCQELSDYIEELSVDNPVIEVQDSFTGVQDQEKLRRKLEWLDSIDEENKVYYKFSEDMDDEEPMFLSNVCLNVGDDLKSYLMDQLSAVSLLQEEYNAARYIIESLDENGYLRESTEDIAKLFGITEEKTEGIIKIIQSFEPWGVGARDLRECLLIQLTNKGLGNPELSTMINNHLDDLSKNKLHLASKQMGISIEKVKKLYSIIKSLNPKPGASFKQSGQPRYIIPDVVVAKFKDYYEVMLIDYSIPTIKMSSFYKDMLCSSTDAETQKYITKKIEQANWAIKCIEQRNATLLSVSKAIVDIQKNFFDKGPRYLCSMVLKDVADRLGIHESTVSRAVNGKYLQSTWGIYELKYFFTHGLSGDMESGMAPREVKPVIRDIINGEDGKKPYSDQKIAELLKQRGISLSRRTVAKYREEMNIPNASGRKEH